MHSSGRLAGSCVQRSQETRAQRQTSPLVSLPGSLASRINYCFVGQSISLSMWWAKFTHTVLQNYLALLAPYFHINFKVRLRNAIKKKKILGVILIRLSLLNLLDLFGRKFLFLYFPIQKHINLFISHDSVSFLMLCSAVLLVSFGVSYKAVLSWNMIWDILCHSHCTLHIVFNHSAV